MADTAKKTANILIIDDDETQAELIEETVKNTPYAKSIYLLHTASEALSLLNKKEQYADTPTPDIILLDLQMPDFSGHDFLRVVKEDPQFKHIPVVILSASDKPTDVDESYRLYANCFIEKPTNFMTFKKTISVVIEFWLGVASLPQSSD